MKNKSRTSWIGHFALIMGTCFATAQLKASEELPVIGLDENGQEVLTHIPKDRYKKRITEQLGQLQFEALSTLETLQTGKKWKLHTLSLGVSVDIQLGLSSLLAFGITPRFTVVFSNRKNPIIP